MIQKKRMKLLVASLLSLLLVAVSIPASAFANDMPDFSVEGTITLENDLTINETVDMWGDRVIDLNGHTITYTGESGSYLFNFNRNSIVGSKIVIKNGNIKAENGRGITGTGVYITLENVNYVGPERGLGIYGGTTTIDKNSVITTTGSDAAVFIRTKDNVKLYGPAGLNVYGKVYQTAEKDGSFGISGNGTDLTGETAINIYAGAEVESKSAPGIYHPHNGTMVVDGKVTGTTGIEVRAGNVTINENAVITATAPKYASQPNGNGSTSEGAALAINQHTTKQDILSTVNGGTFTGAKALIVDGVQEAASQRAAGSVVANIKKGTFNGSVEVANNGGSINVDTGKFTDLDDATVNVNGAEVATITNGSETYTAIGLLAINEALADMEQNGVADNATLTIDKAPKGSKFVVPAGVKVINKSDDEVMVNDDALEAGKEVQLEKPEQKPDPDKKPEPKPEQKPDPDKKPEPDKKPAPQTGDANSMIPLVVMVMAAGAMAVVYRKKNN